MNKTPDQLGCTIKRKAGTYNCYTVTLKGMTKGGILSLQNALRKHAEQSPVGKDVYDFVKDAIFISGDPELKKDCEEIGYTTSLNA